MFEGRTPVPLSATILYFERSAKPELIAYDLIERSPTTGRLTIQRRLVVRGLGDQSVPYCESDWSRCREFSSPT